MDSLIRGLLEPNPEKRLGSKSADDVKNHPFFKEVDWSKVGTYHPPYVPHKLNLNRMKVDPPLDMGAFVEATFFDDLRKFSTKKFTKSFQFGSQFEFLKYDLLHSINKKTANTIKYSSC